MSSTTKLPSIEVVFPTPDNDTIDGAEGPLATILTNIDADKRPTRTPCFITLPENQLQVAFMRKEKGDIIPAHRHFYQTRVIDETQEVLIIMCGRVRVDLYRSNGKFETERVLTQGDVIILHGGGHGFVMLEDSEIYEVKQGPYKDQKSDKEYFL